MCVLTAVIQSVVSVTVCTNRKLSIKFHTHFVQNCSIAENCYWHEYNSIIAQNAPSSCSHVTDGCTYCKKQSL